MSTKNRSLQTRSYFDHVKLALEGFASPPTLGEQSPLAAPYFLGAVLHGPRRDPAMRGQTLCTEIEHAITALWGGQLPATGQEMLAAVDEEDHLRTWRAL